MFNPVLAPIRITAPSNSYLKPIIISFNSTSPIPIALALAADRVKVAVLETFNGTFSLEIGDSENHSRFVNIPNNQLVAGNIFDFNCGYLYSSFTYIYAYITGTATSGKLYLYFQDVNSIIDSSEIPSGGLGGDWGINNYRYEYRANAGGISDADRRSGFYQSSGTLSNYPVNSGIWHFLNISSDNSLNNLQICGLATDQLFYGRKTNGNAAQGWSQFITTFNAETRVTGRFGINNSGTLGAFADINCSSNVIGLRITGNASQTQDLAQFRNSSGTILANINSAGNLSVQSVKTNLVGSATRIANIDLNGNIGAGGDVVDGFITNSTVINLLVNNSNWTNKVYIGTAITGTFAGQVYVSSDYYYFFKSDNLPVRMLLS